MDHTDTPVVPDTLWTRADLARYARVSLSTVDKLLAEEKLPPPTLCSGKTMRWDPVEVVKYMREERD